MALVSRIWRSRHCLCVLAHRTDCHDMSRKPPWLTLSMKGVHATDDTVQITTAGQLSIPPMQHTVLQLTDASKELQTEVIDLWSEETLLLTTRTPFHSRSTTMIGQTHEIPTGYGQSGTPTTNFRRRYYLLIIPIWSRQISQIIRYFDGSLQRRLTSWCTSWPSLPPWTRSLMPQMRHQRVKIIDWLPLNKGLCCRWQDSLTQEKTIPFDIYLDGKGPTGNCPLGAIDLNQMNSLCRKSLLEALTSKQMACN